MTLLDRLHGRCSGIHCGNSRRHVARTSAHAHHLRSAGSSMMTAQHLVVSSIFVPTWKSSVPISHTSSPCSRSSEELGDWLDALS